MLYAADVWGSRLAAKGRGKQGGWGACSFASLMARTQRMVTLIITGGFRSSATDLLDCHANILPFQQALRKMCHHVTLRLATLPESHPLANGIKTAFNYCKKREFTKQKRHPSPLHQLFNEFRIYPGKMEKILPVRHFPKWEPDTTISITKGEKDAVREENEAKEDLRVYSD
ncbi:hypothetical protein CY34DRAFT_52906, partial [Suillus luteus UH-Slu-Lm8-n1]